MTRSLRRTGLALACLLIAGCPAKEEAEPEAPDSFELVAPDTGALDVPRATTLTWTEADRADHYRVEIAHDALFSALALETTSGGLSLAIPPGALDAYTTWFWRVTAVNAEGERRATNAPFVFTTPRPGFAEWSHTGSAGRPTSVVLAGTDALLVAGVDAGGWRIEKRARLDGALDPGFSASESGAFPLALVVDSGFFFAGGFSSAGFDYDWRLEKRRLDDGSVVASFGTGGVLTLEGGTDAPDVLYGLAVDESALYVVGGDYSTSERFRFQKLDRTTGAPMWSVTGGEANIHRPRGFLVLGDAIFAGGESATGIGYLEKRSTATGGLVTGFGVGGVVDESGYGVASLAVTPDGGLIIGGVGELSRRDLVSGAPAWSIPMDGVVLSVHVFDGIVYAAVGSDLPSISADFLVLAFDPSSGDALPFADLIGNPLASGAIDVDETSIYGGHTVAGEWVVSSWVR